MKKLPQLPLLALLSLFVFVLACQKEISPDSLEFNVGAAKEWWYGSFRKTTDYINIDWDSPIAPPIGSSTKKYPNWKKAIAYKKSGFNIVELPLFYNTNNILLPGMQDLNNTTEGVRIAKTVIHKLLLIKKQNHSVAVRTCSIIPSPSYAQKMGYDISQINLNSIPSDFEGYLMIAKWELKLVNLIEIKSGKPVRKIRLVSKYIPILTNKTTETCASAMYVPQWHWVCAYVPTGDAIADQEYCQEIGHWYDSGGTYEFPPCNDPGQNIPGPLEECMLTGNMDDCYCLLWGIGCGNDPNGNTEPLPLLQNNVVDPCLHAMVENAISLDCRNKIATFINNVYSNSQLNHLYFRDAILQAPHNGDDAYTITAPIVNMTELKTTITLNNSQLGSATREYIAATILHEVVHAWIDYKYPVPVENAQQHELMASTARFNIMRNALMEMFPNMSSQDASDLTWGGLGSTILFNTLPPAEITRIQQVNIAYKNHTNNTGTPC